MTKKKGFKRAIAWVLATGMAIGLAVTGGGGGLIVDATSINDAGYTVDDGYNSAVDTSATSNYGSVLGRATAYGVVADTFTLKNHAETNFAVKNYINEGYVLEPDLAGTAPMSFIVGNIYETD